MSELYKCGTLVKPHLNNIEAMITAISIRFEVISYECSYFLNGEYKAIWLNELEFLAVGSVDKSEIGYKK